MEAFWSALAAHPFATPFYLASGWYVGKALGEFVLAIARSAQERVKPDAEAKL